MKENKISLNDKTTTNFIHRNSRYIDKDLDLIENYQNNKKNKKIKYKINRNEPCPCGSGKKFKKCCARVEPENSIDYYLEEIYKNITKDFHNFPTKEKEIFYDTLKSANRDHPTFPLFSNLAGHLAVSLERTEEGLAYLLKNYRIVKKDLPLEIAFLITTLFIELGQLDKAKKITEEFIDFHDSPSLLMVQSELKFKFNEVKEAIKLLEQGYKKSNNDIYYLNDMISILIENRIYKKAYQLMADHFYQFNVLGDDPNENEAESAKLMIDVLFGIEKIISTKKYKKYIEIIVEIFDIININQKFSATQIENIKEVIEHNKDLGFFLVTLAFYNNEHYFISKNDDIILSHTSDPELIIGTIVEANYYSGDYQKVINNFKHKFNEQFMNTIAREYLTIYLMFYLHSLYELNNKKEMKEILSLLSKALNEEIITVIKEAFLNLNLYLEFEILQFIKEVNNNQFFQNQKITDIQLTTLLDSYHIVHKQELFEKQKEWIEKLLAEFKNNDYDKDSFIYHYAKRILAITESKEPSETLKEIIQYPAGSRESRSLKYIIIIKDFDPTIIINDPPEADKPLLQDYSFYEMLAKFKNEDNTTITQAIKQYDYSFDTIANSLLLVMDLEKSQVILANSYNFDNFEDYLLD